MKVYIWILLVSLSFFGCEKQFSSEFIFEIGESHELEDQWSLKLLDIPEDSRCPSLGECIWEGRIVTDFELRHFDLVTNFPLSLGAKTEIPMDTVIGEFSFQLLSVDPFPELEAILDKSKYRAKLKVERIEE